MQLAAIFDLDGTLCDVSSIRYYVDPSHPDFPGRKRFDLFHAHSIDCPPNPRALAEYHAARARGLSIIIVTARKEQWLYHSMLWLHEQGIEYGALFMRADDDNRPDYEVKADILTRIRTTHNVVLAVDDNPAVIALWQEHGIETRIIPGWEERT